MASGRRRHRVTIQRPSNVNEGGVMTVAWSDFVTLWAEKNDISGREFWQAEQANSKITTRWRINWMRGLNSHMRIVDGNDRYHIDYIIDRDGKRRELELMTERIEGEYQDRD